ncbi:MAG: HmuY family protein [Gemmatimonadetes bacterium]|nr:HmuY family protein [Gemmatimonadota bacterium]
MGLGRLRAYVLPGALAAAIFAAAGALVVASLRRPTPLAFAPTPAAPAEVGAARVGPLSYTVDASSQDAWRYFDFSRASAVERPGALDWDLALRRHHIIVNGGPGFSGQGGVLDLGRVPFDSVGVVPEAGYALNRAGRDTVNPVIERWYDYGFTSHLLTPKPRVYAVRTADGRYAKLQIVSYYCPGASAGCLTFRYVYQGDGTRRLGVSSSGTPLPAADTAKRSNARGLPPRGTRAGG